MMSLIIQVITAITPMSVAIVSEDDDCPPLHLLPLGLAKIGEAQKELIWSYYKVSLISECQSYTHRQHQDAYN